MSFHFIFKYSAELKSLKLLEERFLKSLESINAMILAYGCIYKISSKPHESSRVEPIRIHSHNKGENYLIPKLHCDLFGIIQFLF